MEPKGAHNDEAEPYQDKIKDMKKYSSEEDEKKDQIVANDVDEDEQEDDDAEAKLDLEVELEWKAKRNEVNCGQIAIARTEEGRRICNGLSMYVFVMFM